MVITPLKREANHQTIAEKTCAIIWRIKGKGTIEFYPIVPSHRFLPQLREDAVIATGSIRMPQVEFTTNQKLQKKKRRQVCLGSDAYLGAARLRRRSIRINRELKEYLYETVKLQSDS